MKLHYSSEGFANCRFKKIRAVIAALGLEVENVVHQVKEDLSKLSAINILPLLETPQGTFFSTNTIIRYLALTAGNKLYGGDSLHQRALVDQWLDITTCDFDAAVGAVVAKEQGKQVDTKKVSEDIHKFLKFVENTLNEKKFLVGDSLSIADLSLATNLSVIFTIMFGEQQRKAYPNLTTWYLSIAAVDANVGSKDLPKNAHKAFQGKKQKGQKKGEKKQQKKQEPVKQVPKEQPKKEEGDDLFDDEPAAPVPVAPVKTEKPKAKKPKPVAKSIVVFDVKVYEQQTDLLQLFNKIKEEIVIDGLIWNNEPKILPVAYGMNKLQIGCVIEDQKVSVDDFCQKIEEWEEVQSTDTVSFQKL